MRICRLVNVATWFSCFYPNSDLHTAKTRPALIVQADNLQTGLPQGIVAMITSRLFRANHPSRVVIVVSTPAGQQSGLLTDSVVMTELVFSELFAVMPFTLKAGLPWCMVEISWVDDSQINELPNTGNDWWSEKVDVLIDYVTTTDIAKQLSCAIMPQMPSDDILYVLEKIEEKCDKNRYHIPPKDIHQKQLPPAHLLSTITNTFRTEMNG